MANNYSGTSMCGRIENTNRVKPIKAHCASCYHAQMAQGKNEKDKGIYYCTHYSIRMPHRQKCARYSGVAGKDLYQTYKKRQKKIKQKSK